MIGGLALVSSNPCTRASPCFTSFCKLSEHHESCLSCSFCGWPSGRLIRFNLRCCRLPGLSKTKSPKILDLVDELEMILLLSWRCFLCCRVIKTEKVQKPMCRPNTRIIIAYPKPLYRDCSERSDPTAAKIRKRRSRSRHNPSWM